MQCDILSELINYGMSLRVTADYWDKDLFQQQVYSIWAVDELYLELTKHPERNQEEILEDFVKRMDQYALINSKKSRMFSIAKDTALDIIDQIITRRIINESK